MEKKIDFAEVCEAAKKKTEEQLKRKMSYDECLESIEDEIDKLTFQIRRAEINLDVLNGCRAYLIKKIKE